ncbi:hypothetical protein ABPG77_001185 [Micractinium sp. CCAP 211/92]
MQTNAGVIPASLCHSRPTALQPSAAAPVAAMSGTDEPKFDPTQSSTWVNYVRVMNHVVQKGIQAGGVVGLGAVVPAVAYRQHKKGVGWQESLPALATAVCKTTLVTLALSVALGVGRLASIEDLKAGLEDRAYRLHYNQGQNRADLFAQVGIAAGGAAAVAFLPATAAVVMGSAAAGAAAGVLVHVATRRED